MTVRLLVDWKDYSNGRLYKVGNLLTTDSYTESGLVSSGLASSNLVGGTPYVDPVPAESYDEAVTGGQKGNLVVATTNPLTGGIEESAGGKRIRRGENGHDVGVLVIGGDHPYQQWWGTNGNDGMLAMYQAAGVDSPYCAINTSGSVGQTDMMTYQQIAAMRDKGMEIVAHGERHFQDHSAPTTGITVRYTGPAATAAFQVTGGNAVGTTAGSVEDFSFSLANASYDTIAELVAAIDALPNWSASYASELSGTEKSTKILTGASRDAKTASVDWPAGGAISVKYNGSTYRRCWLTNDGTTMRLYADGKGIVAVTLATSTLQQVVTALNAVSGVTAALAGGTTVPPYVSGTEDATNIKKWNGPLYLYAYPVSVDAGLSSNYIRRRNLSVCKQTLARNGLPVTAYVQSGGNFFRGFANSPDYTIYRGNNSVVASIVSMPQSDVDNFVLHTALTTTDYTGSRGVALVESLADSPGHVVCALIHKLLPDSSSGFNLPTVVNGNHDQTEAQMVAILSKVNELRSAGRINVSTVGRMRRDCSAKPPGNLIFNPKFKNSGESLGGVITNYAVPGWMTDASTGVTSLTISDGVVSVVNSTASSIYPISTHVNLRPGTYEFTADIDIDGFSSGEGVALTYGRSPALLMGMDGHAPNATIISSAAITGQGEIKLRIVIPSVKQRTGRIISVAEPFNLSTNKNIKVNWLAKGLTSDIDCSAGAASASSVRAHEIAAAINAAVKSNAAYPAELHNCCRAENGKLIIEAPYVTSDRTAKMNVQSGSTADACNVIFGSYFVEAYGVGADDVEWYSYPVSLGIKINANVGATVNFSNPCLKQICGSTF